MDCWFSFVPVIGGSEGPYVSHGLVAYLGPERTPGVLGVPLPIAAIIVVVATQEERPAIPEAVVGEKRTAVSFPVEMAHTESPHVLCSHVLPSHVPPSLVASASVASASTVSKCGRCDGANCEGQGDKTC